MPENPPLVNTNTMLCSDLLPLLERSIDIQAGLVSLTAYLLWDIAERSVAEFKERQSDDIYLRYLDATDLGVGRLSEYPKARSKTLTPNLQAFVQYAQQTHLRVACTDQRRVHGQIYNGWYTKTGRQPEIYLAIGEADFAEIKAAVEQDRIRTTDIYRVLQHRETTLTHELRHAYEDWISEGRFRQNSQSVAADDAELARQRTRDDAALAQKAHALYLRDPIEISARYSQTVAALERQRLTLSWPAYAAEFRYQLGGWRELGPKTQTRLMTRLAAQWQDGRTLVQPDIKGAVQRLQDRLHKAGAEVWLRAGDRYIGVQNITLKQPDQIAALLRPILLLADHYGLTVALDDKLPIPAVRPLGFQNQRPRSPNGGKRDYSLPLGTVYLRRPVNRRAAAAATAARA